MITAFLCFALLQDVPELLDQIVESKNRSYIESQLRFKVKDHHVPLVMRAIAKGLAVVRPHLVRVFQTLRTGLALKALQGIQDKYDWACRGEVAYARKISGDSGGIDYLVISFGHPRMKTADRLAVVRFLGAPYAGKKKRVAQVLCRVLDKETDVILIKRLLTAVAEQGDPTCLPVVRRFAEEVDGKVYHEALAALILLGEREALDRALDEIEAGRVTDPAFYLAIQKGGGRSILPRLRAALEKLEDVNIRLRLIDTLTKMRDRKALSLFNKLAKSENVSLSRSALNGILALAGRGNVPGLIKLLDNKDASTRIRIAKTLLALDDISGLPVLEKELSNTSQVIQVAAIQAMGGCRRKEVVALLLLAMDHKNGSVRSIASSSLVYTLGALFPYRQFTLGQVGYNPSSSDRKTAIEKIRVWWAENRED